MKIFQFEYAAFSTPIINWNIWLNWYTLFQTMTNMFAWYRKLKWPCLRNQSNHVKKQIMQITFPLELKLKGHNIIFTYILDMFSNICLQKSL